MRKYIFISPGSETSRQMLLDVEKYKSEDFQFIKCAYSFRNKIQKKLFEIYFKINARISLPFNFIWKSAYSIFQIDFSKEIEYYIILGNGDFNYYRSKELNKLKEQYNIHYIVYLIDPLSGLMSEFMRKNIFSLKTDCIYTFDYWDAKKMDAIHTMNLYSKKDIARPDNIYKNSVYFVGTNKKNRVESIHKIWDRFQKAELKCKFNIVNVRTKQQTRDGINYNIRNSYDKVLEELQEYECILEVLQEGQSGVTLRYYEAIAYNKKLITNNQLVRKLPFYHPSYMYVYEKIEDIDLEWIKTDVNVDYGYNNEFSPINFIQEIKEKVS